MLFHLVFQQNLSEEVCSNVKTKTIPKFAVKVFQRSNNHFYDDLIYHLKHLYSIEL